uniref:Rad21/Rec8-like protein N-terminal domain-containing protein n=1 Tax=Plectus sambesii TaxID=2011161 RepID=A0A914XF19_9BILA
MFYSVDALNSRNGRFRLIWRAATATRKKLSKRECMEVSVRETCEELLHCIPTSRPSAIQAKTKYSLYLLAQLLYGTVIIFREQMDFFFLDVRHLWNKMRRPGNVPIGVDLPLDKRQGRDVTLPEAVPHGARRPTGPGMRPQTLYDLNFVFDFSSDTSASSILDFSELDSGRFLSVDYASAMERSLSSTLADISNREVVRSVRPEDITMNEYVPNASRIVNDEQGEELMPPTQADLDILQNMLMDTRADDFDFTDQQLTLGEPSIIDEQLAQQPMEQEQPMEEQQQQEKDRVETPPSEPPTFELEAVPAEVLEERAERRLTRKGRNAKHRTIVDSDTFITKELMQSAIADYSDIVWTKEELMVDPTLDKRPSVDKLFAKRPIYIRYLATPLMELMDEMMAPRPFERMTAREAWTQRGLLLHREETPSMEERERNELLGADYEHQQLLEAEPMSKRRKISAPERTPSPALLNQSPTLLADRTPDVLESERAAGREQFSVGSFEKGRASSMLPPESMILADGDDVYMGPEGVLDPISQYI